MMNALVAYATKRGQTQKVAHRIASRLSDLGFAVDVSDLQHAVAVEPGRFQLVVVGAPILAGGYPRSVTRFLRQHRDALRRTPTAFFSVGLAVMSRTSDGRAQSLKVVAKLLKRTGFAPQRVELIAGALPYSKYGFLTRFLMRRIVANEGGDTDTSRDYEYTDWGAVDRFAQDLDSLVGAPSTPLPSEPSSPLARAASTATARA